MAVFLKMCDDVIIVELSVDLFALYCKQPLLCAAVNIRILPSLIDIITKHTAGDLPYLGLAASAVDIIAAIVRFSPPPMSSDMFSQAFLTVVNAMLASKDSTFLQNGAECVRLFVEKHSQQLFDWSDGSQTGLHYAAHLIAFLLHCDYF